MSPDPRSATASPSRGGAQRAQRPRPTEWRPGRRDVGPLFEALADPTRRQVVTLLVDGPRRAGDIAAAADTSNPAMSRHLRVLLRAGLIADERDPADARARIFRLRPDSIAAAQAWLDQIQAQWHEQLQSFKHHVEGSRTP